MKNSIINLLVIALLLLTDTSCHKPKDDQPEARATFSIKANGLTVSRMRNLGSYSFSKAKLGVSKVKFKKEVGDDDQEYKYEGAYTFNILDGTSQPQLNPVGITPGKFKKVKIKVDNVMPSGNSIEIKGAYAENGTEYLFEFTSTMDEDLEIENPTGIQVDENQLVHFVVYIDLESLFNGVDFSTATVGNDGIIHINDNNNSDLADIIEDNFDDVMDFDTDD